MSDEQINKIIGEAYNDLEMGFQLAPKLYQKLKQLNNKIKLSQVKKYIENQHSNQLTKQDKRPKHFNSVWADEPGQNIEINLMIYDRYKWNHYKYILNCIDVHSRYLVSISLTNRRAETIVEALEKTFKQFGAYPSSINADQEFNNNLVNKFLEKHEIRAYFSELYALNHNPIVERLNCTLAMMIQRWQIQSKSFDWPTILPKIVKNYNNTYHSTIKAKPIDVLHEKDTNKQMVYRLTPDFKIGDVVRYKIRKSVFAKDNSLSYSTDTYVIYKMKGNKIWLRNVQTQDEIEKSFKPYEIVKINTITTLLHENKNKPNEEEIIHKKTVKRISKRK